ncbi:MAG: hypothetical protein ABI668_03475 [Sphingorhabdus sp.]
MKTTYIMWLALVALSQTNCANASSGSRQMTCTITGVALGNNNDGGGQIDLDLSINYGEFAPVPESVSKEAEVTSISFSGGPAELNGLALVNGHVKSHPKFRSPAVELLLGTDESPAFTIVIADKSGKQGELGLVARTLGWSEEVPKLWTGTCKNQESDSTRDTE